MQVRILPGVLCVFLIGVVGRLQLAAKRMGYATVKVIFDLGADELHAHFKRHASLYRPRPTGAKEFSVEIMAGKHCSAIWSNDLACPDMFLYPIGPELAAVWMDVRYVDGDAWELSCYMGFEHQLSHNVNPWPNNPDFRYDAQAEKAVRYRIDKLCRLLPQFADVVPPYLLLWKHPTDLSAPDRLSSRTGKARETDQFEYGNAYQYQDFLRCFGIDLANPQHRVQVRL